MQQRHTATNKCNHLRHLLPLQAAHLSYGCDGEPLLLIVHLDLLGSHLVARSQVGGQVHLQPAAGGPGWLQGCTAAMLAQRGCPQVYCRQQCTAVSGTARTQCRRTEPRRRRRRRRRTSPYVPWPSTMPLWYPDSMLRQPPNSVSGVAPVSGSSRRHSVGMAENLPGPPAGGLVGCRGAWAAILAACRRPWGLARFAAVAGGAV